MVALRLLLRLIVLGGTCCGSVALKRSLRNGRSKMVALGGRSGMVALGRSRWRRLLWDGCFETVALRRALWDGRTGQLHWVCCSRWRSLCLSCSQMVALRRLLRFGYFGLIGRSGWRLLWVGCSGSRSLWVMVALSWSLRAMVSLSWLF